MIRVWTEEIFESIRDVVAFRNVLMLIRALGSSSFLEFCSSFSDWVE
jgi:hypothetical protein